MVPYGARTLFDGWRRKVGACLQIMFYFIEYPGIADGGAADHDAVNSIPVTVDLCFLRGVDISVAEDGDMDAGIFFYFGDKGPVCLAFIQLRPGPAMNGQRLDPYVLQAEGHLFDVLRLIIPS